MAGGEALKLAVNSYFTSEAQEMYILIAYAVALVVVAAGFAFFVGGRFAQILAAGMVIVALVFGWTGVSLLSRDTVNRAELVRVADSAPAEERSKAFAAEKDRMQKVIDNYPNIRWTAIILALIGIGLLVFWKGSYGDSIAAVLLLMALSTVVVDYFSEERARLYVERLDAAGVG